MKNLTLLLTLVVLCATTAAYSDVIFESNFDASWGGMITQNVVGAQEWDRDNTYGIGSTRCARMSGYDSGHHTNIDWLISASMDFDNFTGETLAFSNAYNYSGPDFQLLVSTDYSGSGDPAAANWTDISSRANWSPGGSWDWYSSGTIDVSDFNGSSVYIGFKYVSSDSAGVTLEIDDFSVKGTPLVTPPLVIVGMTSPTGVVKSEPSENVVFTTTCISNGTAEVGYGTTADGSGWTWETATVSGSGPYTGTVTIPASATPAVNYFASRWTVDGTTYYGWNSASQTNKEMLTAEYAWVVRDANTMYDNDFEFGWLDLMTYSSVGAQEWQIDNVNGIGGSACARISGYSGGAQTNVDWIVTPPMDFNYYLNETIVFSNTFNYSGPALQLLISTDYTGGDPNLANWTDITSQAAWSGGGWDWVPSGAIDVSSVTESAVYVAFKYTSSADLGAAAWEVDDLDITGTPIPEPTLILVPVMALFAFLRRK
jgi:hypothetical protein